MTYILNSDNSDNDEWSLKSVINCRPFHTWFSCEAADKISTDITRRAVPLWQLIKLSFLYLMKQNLDIYVFVAAGGS